MQFAFDNSGKRVRPTFSGQKGSCPLCEGSVIAKCGEIYTRHWSHSKDRNCDPWKEHETPWHRNWKSRFPEEMQEVVIERDSERHRADVMTNSGTVIEFQHSSISKDTIRVREEFYECMIWVIDASPFIENIRKRSVVKTRLKILDNEAHHQISCIKKNLEDELQELTKILNTKEKELDSSLNILNQNKEVLYKLKEDINNIDKVNREIHDKWESGDRYWQRHSADVTNEIESEYRLKFKNASSEMSDIELEKQKILNSILEINGLPSILIDSKIFKIVPYSSITAQNFHRARVINKESRQTLFLEAKSITNLSELRSYAYKLNKYDFAIDPSNALDRLQDKVVQLDSSYREIDVSIPKWKSEMREKLLQRLELKINRTGEELEQLEIEYNNRVYVREAIKNRLERKNSEYGSNLAEEKNDIEKEYNEIRFKAMKEHKGMYTFEWKRRRKSWHDASAPIYFDFGDDFVYEKIREDLFRRMTVEEFISHHTKFEGVK